MEVVPGGPMNYDNLNGYGAGANYGSQETVIEAGLVSPRRAGPPVPPKPRVRSV